MQVGEQILSIRVTSLHSCPTISKLLYKSSSQTNLSITPLSDNLNRENIALEILHTGRDGEKNKKLHAEMNWATARECTKEMYKDVGHPKLGDCREVSGLQNPAKLRGNYKHVFI